MKYLKLIGSSIFLLSSVSLAAPNVILLSGECLRKVAQDRAAITLTAEALESSPGVASTKTTTIYNNLRERVKKLALKDFESETVEVSLYEDFDYSQNGRKSKGFRSRQGLRVETSETGRLGEVIKIGNEIGIKKIGSIGLFVSPQAYQSEREACLEEAFRNAKSKAERLAKVAGVKLGNVLEMNESGPGRVPRPEPRSSKAMMDFSSMESSAGAPGVESRSETIQVTLGVLFQIN